MAQQQQQVEEVMGIMQKNVENKKRRAIASLLPSPEAKRPMLDKATFLDENNKKPKSSPVSPPRKKRPTSFSSLRRFMPTAVGCAGAGTNLVVENLVSYFKQGTAVTPVPECADLA